MTEATIRSHRERLSRVLRHLDVHVWEPCSLDRLAAIACLSPHHFHRVFKAFTGMTLAAYVRRRRLIMAAERLAAGGCTVLEVALQAGFGSHESFTRAFSGLFGMTPSAFRARALQTPERSLPSPTPLPAIGGSDMEMTIQTPPRMRVACVRHVGPYNTCQPAWDALCAWGMLRGLFGPQTTFLGIGWDDPESTPPEEIRYDACFTVDESVEAEGDISIQHIGGGPHATTVHLGSFEGLEETYKQLYAAVLAREDLQLSDAPAFEVYRTDPKTTPPEKNVTEIYVPLAE